MASQFLHHQNSSTLQQQSSSHTGTILKSNDHIFMNNVNSARSGSFCGQLPMQRDIQQPVMHRKPLRIRNVSNKHEVFDSLHYKVAEPTICTPQACLASLMAMGGRGPGEPRPRQEVLEQAKDFMDQYFTSIRRSNSPAYATRWAQVQKEVDATGTYQLTETELVYGAKLAWRNSARCIGRIQWSKLQVFDCRYVTTTSGMFEAICNHIKYSTNKGNIRSAITVFPQRSDGKHDYRVWNPQFVSYAGYKQPDGSIIGDPHNVEFTEVCLKLGWKPKGIQGRFDILPLVLSANGHDPDYFDIPSELILEVPISHPTLKWFEELKLQWYCLPAVSSMMFDCGGIEFTAAPFNGWYMATEIGCRNFCDVQRYNMLEPIALRMGLDTRTPVTLWKDRALVECNIAVLHSFQSRNITIVDHHTASESFMKHYENEFRLRNGCPADWIWIVPPMSGSATPVFHQEMALYKLKPSYEYQEAAWKCHVWKKGRDPANNTKKTQRKFHFKQIARAVKFTSKLFGRALSRRIKATVLYATETGKSEGFAKKLGDIFGHAFNAEVYCMSDYDISSIEHEALLLVVTSTFGNGDPPENGEVFAQNLYSLKLNDANFMNGDSKLSMASSKSFIKANSQTDMGGRKHLDRLESLRGSVSDNVAEDTFGPLSNVRFAVFALGSSAYPNFCAFGKYVDNILGELGGERLLKMATGDEMCGQEQMFRKWAPEVFNVACETFCLDDDDTFLEATMALQQETLTVSNIRFTELANPSIDLHTSLYKCHNRRVTPCKLLKRTNLHGDNSSRATLLLQFESDLPYQPGDHVGVYASNRANIVDGILKRLQGVTNPDTVCELQALKENHTSNGIVRSWEAHDRLPPCSIRILFERFLDLTTPPSPNLLQHFATLATSNDDRERLTLLATNSAVYEDWRHWRFPNLLEVLEEFPSVQPHAALLAAQLSILQPRFYSISSSPAVYHNQIHLTVAVVSYKTEDGDGPVHYGVCSNYLQNVPEGDDVYIFVRSAANFHLPEVSKPCVLVGPGTGIAPFRSFWQQRLYELENDQKIGRMWLFFGCRQSELDLYKEEKSEMLERKVLQRVFLALSREKNIPKTYVQDLALKEAEEIYKILVVEKGHFYVCGDCTMAEHVYQTLKQIIRNCGNLSESQVETYMLKMRDENRYHEDIFGITLRTAEVHNRSRESARIRMASEP